jgi:hypothetical protein
MSHVDLNDGRPPKYINYRDLSVQQLGSVYERILEHGLRAQEGRVAVAENPSARKGSGSYYTPEELVTLIIERAVGPLASVHAKYRCQFFSNLEVSVARCFGSGGGRGAEPPA